MKKKIIAVVCMCFTLMSVSHEIHASEITPTVPVITYDGKAQEFYVEDALLVEGKLPDLFTEFKNCMPGDVRVQEVEVVVKNLGDNTATISLLAEKADSRYEELMKNITCQITSDELDITKTIWDRIILGNFKKDDSKLLTMTLEFPIEMDNSFQNFIGQVDWYLDVEMTPNINPETGDHSSINIYLLVGGVSVALILLLLIIKYRNKNIKK